MKMHRSAIRALPALRALRALRLHGLLGPALWLNLWLSLLSAGVVAQPLPASPTVPALAAVPAVPASAAVPGVPAVPHLPRPAAVPAVPGLATPPALPGAPAAPAAPAVEGRSYALGEFQGIEITGSAHVRFRQGDSEAVFVEGDEETQKAVMLDVRGGQLFIRPAGSWKFWASRRVRVNVTARDLQRVVISGAADLQAAAPVQVGRLHISISGAGLARFDQLKAEQLSFHVSGAGDGQVAGDVNQLQVQVSGKSDFRAEGLMSQRATVRVSGIADVKLWVMQELSVTVSGIGTVDYWGSPSVQRQSSGVARINARGSKPAPP